MASTLLALMRLISAGLAPITLAASIVAYLHPPFFLVFRESFLWLFAATMFAIGVVLETAELRETLQRPGRIGLGVLTQFTVMPVLGLLAAFAMTAAGLPESVAVGFIIVGCAPGAMASNVIVYLAGGAVAYSVALTTVATFLSPVLTPALIELLGRVFVEVPFWPMVRTILYTVAFPLAAGMLLRRVLGPRAAVAAAVAPAVAAISIAIICAYAVAANAGRIGQMSGAVAAAVVVLNALGYAGGWAAARLFGFDAAHRLTLAIEIGMQNAGLGVALALKHFAPEAALAGALFAVWCVLTAAGASSVLARRRYAAAVALFP